MFSAIRKLPSVARSNVVRSRNLYSYIGPARNQMSKVESWCHGVAIYLGILGCPMYILYNITNYRGVEKLGNVMKNKNKEA